MGYVCTGARGGAVPGAEERRAELILGTILVPVIAAEDGEVHLVPCGG